MRRLASQLGMSDSEIHRQLKKGDSLAFEKTDLYQQVFRLAEKKAGKTLPREMLPGIQLRVQNHPKSDDGVVCETG